MKSFPRQRLILFSLLYCFAAALISGVCSTQVPESLLVTPSLKTWTATVRSLASTENIETTEVTKAADETPIDEPQADSSELINLQSFLPQLYHTPEVFALDYKEMTENLKVFIYPNSENVSYEYDVTSEKKRQLEGEEASESQFLNSLTASIFVTKVPEEAHLFLLPLSFTALVTKLGPRGVGSHLRHYLQGIRETFPFWDRSLGSDHFYFATEGYEPFNHRNNLEFTKNAIQVARSPLPPSQFFYPHKDVAVPSYQAQGVVESRNPTAIQQRSHLAYIGFQSLSLPSAWSSDDDFVFDFSQLHDAKFCVTDSLQHLVDALRAGCVPVLVSDTLFYDLPFQDILQWREFAVLVGASEMERVEEVMRSMPAGEYKRRQYLGMQASLHMEWNDPPRPYDAFHMTMFELWLRRHSVQYARRAES